jgi:hypothetical protein
MCKLMFFYLFDIYYGYRIVILLNLAVGAHLPASAAFAG